MRVVSAIGFPASSDSSRAMSSRFLRIRSPRRQSALPRSEADIFAHGPTNASCAALTARSMSAASPSAISAIDSPVAGLSVGKRFPETASRHSEPISMRPPDLRSGAARVSLGFTVGLRGSACVIVDAAPDLAAQASGLDVLDEERGRAVLLAERTVQIFEDAETRVQTHQIDHLEWSHGMIEAELQCLVDIARRRDACLEHVERFVSDERVDARRDEARRLAHHDGFFAHR